MIEIFGWDPAEFKCNPCLKAKRICETRKLDFEFLALSKSAEPEGKHLQHKTELYRRADQKGFVVETLPQVFQNGVHIGGFTELKALLNK